MFIDQFIEFNRPMWFDANEPGMVRSFRKFIARTCNEIHCHFLENKIIVSTMAKFLDNRQRTRTYF